MKKVGNIWGVLSRNVYANYKEFLSASKLNVVTKKKVTIYLSLYLLGNFYETKCI